MGYNIYIRDYDLKKVGEVTEFTKIDMIPRFNAVGTFTLDLPTDCAATKELIKDKAGIIVKKDGQTIFSGTVTSRKRAFDGTNDTMTFSGKDDNFYLSRVLAYPETNGLFSTQAYDVRTGPAETVIKQYVSYNAGPDAPPERNSLTIEADSGLGSTVTGRARFDNLLDLLASISLQGGGLGFNVVQEGSDLVFKVYQPTDKSKSVFFSPLLGNLLSFDYSNGDPESNLVVVGGSGEGTARILDWKADNSSIVKHGRIETFVDRRDTSDLTELEKTIDEELTNKSEKNTFNFVPIDTPQISFNTHYGLGDIVTVVLTQPNEIIEKETLQYFLSFYQSDSMETEKVRKIQEKLDVIQDIVREVKITLDSSGTTINPVVGTQDSNTHAILGIFDKMKKITKRVSNLERRW
jgi:hypothetical protein